MKQAFHSIKFKMKIKKILILSSHLKRSSLLWVDNNSRLLQQKTIKKGNILAFHWCLFETEHGSLEIRNFSSRVEKYFTRFA